MEGVDIIVKLSDVPLKTALDVLDFLKYELGDSVYSKYIDNVDLDV